MSASSGTTLFVDAAQVAGSDGLSGGARRPAEPATRVSEAPVFGVVDALLERNPDPTEEEVRLWLAGNLCRCTGYMRIFEAVLEAAKRQ